MINMIESPSSEIIQSALSRGESPPVAGGDPRLRPGLAATSEQRVIRIDPLRPNGDVEAAVNRIDHGSQPGLAVLSGNVGDVCELRAIGNRLSTVKGTITISIPESI